MDHLATDLALIEDYLKSLDFKSADELTSNLADSIKYSLNSGGKRLRPLLFLNSLRCFEYDIQEFISFAAGIELIHTYTLIHDDLPQLDNDDFRRGQPANHKKFDEATAILAGDALQAKAFELCTMKLPIKAELQLKMLTKLAQMCGSQHLVSGQAADIMLNQQSQPPLNQAYIERINIEKTGALLNAAIITALIAANQDSIITTIQPLGFKLGLHFQLMDDIIEYEAGAQSASVNNFPRLFGLDAAKLKIEELNCEIHQLIAQTELENTALEFIIDKIINRKN